MVDRFELYLPTRVRSSKPHDHRDVVRYSERSYNRRDAVSAITYSHEMMTDLDLKAWKNCNRRTLRYVVQNFNMRAWRKREVEGLQQQLMLPTSDNPQKRKRKRKKGKKKGERAQT